MTTLLWSGAVERFVASEDVRVEIENPAYSVIPGHINAKAVHIYMNALPQFTLSVDDLDAHIRILPLFDKRISVSWLGAKDVKYRMRLPQEGQNAETPRVQAFPPLEGLPGVNSVEEEEADPTEQEQSLWTVELSRVDAEVSELWFFEYRYVGHGRLEGGFERGPDILRVDTSVHQLGPGKLYFGKDQVISHNFRGRIKAEIPEVDPSEHADLGFFDFVRAEIDLKADVVHLEHLSAYLTPGRVTKGGGPLTVKVHMDDGQVADETLISYETEELNFFLEGTSVKTDWSIRLDVHRHAEDDEQATPRLISSSEVSYISFASPNNPLLTLQVHDHQQQVWLASAKIDEDLDVRHAKIDLPHIVSTDLDDISGLTGAGWGSQAGEMHASLSMTLDEEKVFRGPLKAEINGLELRKDPVSAALAATSQARVALDLSNESVALTDFSLLVRDAEFVIGDDKMSDWWMDFESRKVALGWGEPQTLFADLDLRARDAEPLLEALTEGTKTPGVLADLIKLEDLSIRAKVRQRGARLDVMVENMESDFIDFSGRVYQSADTRKMALLVGGKVVSLGIFEEGGKKEFKPFAHAEWLNERLEQLPPPLEQVSGQKP